jgi:hypothetical protein
MLQARDYGIINLTHYPSLSHRKNAFISFMDDLVDITQTHTDLALVLTDFPNIGEPKTTLAYKVLFPFLLAKCAPYLRDMLKACSDELKKESCTEALRILLQCCAAQDQDEQYQMQQAFVNARINDSELIQNFNCRFNNLYKHARLSRLQITDDAQIDQYLRALASVKHTRLQVKFEAFQSHRDAEQISKRSTDL